MSDLAEHMTDAKTGIGYQLVGDYYIPCIEMSKQENYPLGRFARQHLQYLKENHPGVVSRMILNGTLNQHLHQKEQTCTRMYDQLLTQMADAEGVTETMKAENQMQWVGRMNSIRNRAEEIVFHEQICNPY